MSIRDTVPHRAAIAFFSSRMYRRDRPRSAHHLPGPLPARPRPATRDQRGPQRGRVVEPPAGIYRRLADARPGAFLPDLATALTSQSVFLSELGRREEAQAAIEEAAGIYRRLADARPDAFLPDLATALCNMADVLEALQRSTEADAACAEAERIRAISA
jgi:tetratricopeptide (TPR) repeat protein